MSSVYTPRQPFSETSSNALDRASYPASSQEDVSSRLLQDEELGFPDDEQPEPWVESPHEEGSDRSEALTPLDETLERIGMGRYQKTLL
jgi:hypothetical protein